MAAPGALLAPLGLSLRLLGRSWPLPGRSWEPFSSPRGLLWDLFGSLFPTPLEKHENLDFRRQLQRNQGLGVPAGSKIEPRWLPNRSCPRLGNPLALTWRFSALSWRLWAASWRSWGLLGASWGALVAILAQGKTWLSWNGKRVQSESCKHGKKGKSSESSKNRERRVRSKGCKHGKRLTTKPQSIKKAFSSSFAGALRAPAQRFELGLRLGRLSRGRAQQIA